MDGDRWATRPLPKLTRLLAGFLTTAALAPAVADAASPDQQWPVGGPSLAAAQGLAERTWGPVCPAAGVTVVWEDMAPNLNGLSTWDGPGVPAPGSNPSGCAVHLNRSAQWTWPKLCTVVVHEMGHLTGHQHVLDTADVMTLFYAGASPACQALPDPAAALTTTRARTKRARKVSVRSASTRSRRA